MSKGVEGKGKIVSTKSLDQVSPTSGDSFRRNSDDDSQTSHEVVVAANQFKSKSTSSSNDFLMRHHEDFIKFFDRVGIGKLLQGYDETQVLESEKVILNAFAKHVHGPKTPFQKNWLALQHYVYYIYRNVVTRSPSNSNEIIPNVIMMRIRELIIGLTEEDFTQFSVRMFMIVREYAIVTRKMFEGIESPRIAAYLVGLMSYYSAFCSAASKLSPVLKEFDFIIMRNFNVNWLCLNKSVFYFHFFMNPSVQTKIPEFNKWKEEGRAPKHLLESYTCFLEDMSLLSIRWNNLKVQICTLSHEKGIGEPTKYLENDWKTFEAIKKILKSNSWLTRSPEEIQVQEMSELGLQLLSLVNDVVYIPDLLLDPQGHCMCDNCLIAEFRANSVTSPIIPSPYQGIPAQCRLISCYICQDPLALDILVSHVMAKHSDVPIQKTTRIYLTPHQKKSHAKKTAKPVAEIVKTTTVTATTSREPFPFEDIFEKNTELKNSILQIVHERTLKATFGHPDKVEYPSKGDNLSDTEELKHKPARPNDLVFSNKSIAPIFQAPAESSTKITKEPVLKIASKAPVVDDVEEAIVGATKSMEELWSCKAVFETTKHGEKCDGLGECKSKKSSTSSSPVNMSAAENAAFRKPQQRTAMDTKKTEACKTTIIKSSTKSADSSCMGHACGHKCKQEDEKQTTPESKKHVCEDAGTRKCECKYCEVFGNGLTNHVNKATETRDRLRTRLNQRKEKITEHFNASKQAQHNCNAKPNGNVASGKKPDPEPNGPPRVPEVHPVTPPLNVKPTSPVGDGKKSSANSSSSNSQKTSLTRGNSFCAELDRIVNNLPNWSLSSSSSSSLNSIHVDSRDINELINYIEGNKSVDKAALAQKKAAKKARQRLMKAQERERIEKEKKLQEEIRLKEEKRKEERRLKEEKRKEEEKLKLEALERHLADRLKKKKESKAPTEVTKTKSSKQPLPQEFKKNSKKKSKSGNTNEPSKPNDTQTKLTVKGSENSHGKSDKKPNIVEEIPAVVTIQRLAEGENSQATVTITLKGSTPESDKLLLTLVDGQKERLTTATFNSDSKTKIHTEPAIKIQTQTVSINSNGSSGTTNTNKPSQKSKNSKKKKKSNEISKELKEIQKPVKVTLAKKDNNQKKEPVKKTGKPVETKDGKVRKDSSVVSTTTTTTTTTAKTNSANKDDIILPMLRLPPGITITKIEGPPTRNCKVSTNNTPAYTTTTNATNAYTQHTVNSNQFTNSSVYQTSHTNANANTNVNSQHNGGGNHHHHHHHSSNAVQSNHNNNAFHSNGMYFNSTNVYFNVNGSNNMHPGSNTMYSHSSGPYTNNTNGYSNSNLSNHYNYNMYSPNNTNSGIFVSNSGSYPINGSAPHTSGHSNTYSSNTGMYSNNHNYNSNVPVSKSGVIVVDTEKLIQQSINASNNKKNRKKNKKKNRGEQKPNSEAEPPAVNKEINNVIEPQSMVTLKNPIFHTLQSSLNNKPEHHDLPVFNNNQPASIFTNENGMVTIRRPRLQNPYESNGAPSSNFMCDLKPAYGSERQVQQQRLYQQPPQHQVQQPIQQPQPQHHRPPPMYTNFPETNKHNALKAQEILSGLPGIEITKVDKTARNDSENRAAQPAEVSIIPATNGANHLDIFNFNKDDRSYESVFMPRDDIDQVLDADEQELEAFKRFCFQSIPLERRTVSHLNVNDILSKKNNVTYS